MARNRADYGYKLGQIDGTSYLLMWDQNLGSRSLTNDIENAVRDIGQRECIDAWQVIIYYRDSCGQWAEYHAETEEFRPVAKKEISRIANNFKLKNSLYV